jgi:hypothetical protein
VQVPCRRRVGWRKAPVEQLLHWISWPWPNPIVKAWELPSAESVGDLRQVERESSSWKYTPWITLAHEHHETIIKGAPTHNTALMVPPALCSFGKSAYIQISLQETGPSSGLRASDPSTNLVAKNFLAYTCHNISRTVYWFDCINPPLDATATDERVAGLCLHCLSTSTVLLLQYYAHS